MCRTLSTIIATLSSTHYRTQKWPYAAHRTEVCSTNIHYVVPKLSQTTALFGLCCSEISCPQPGSSLCLCSPKVVPKYQRCFHINYSCQGQRSDFIFFWLLIFRTCWGKWNILGLGKLNRTKIVAPDRCLCVCVKFVASSFRGRSSRGVNRGKQCQQFKRGITSIIPDICHGRADGVRVNFFWPV